MVWPSLHGSETRNWKYLFPFWCSHSNTAGCDHSCICTRLEAAPQATWRQRIAWMCVYAYTCVCICECMCICQCYAYDYIYYAYVYVIMPVQCARLAQKIIKIVTHEVALRPCWVQASPSLPDRVSVHSRAAQSMHRSLQPSVPTWTAHTNFFASVTSL